MLLVSLLAGAAAEPALAFRDETAIIYGDSREPKFRASRDYVLKLGSNPKGKTFDFDLVERRVKISAVGEGLWVGCDALKPGVAACDTMRGRIKMRSGNARRPGPVADEPLGRGLPSCPGDPRCPNGG